MGRDQGGASRVRADQVDERSHDALAGGVIEIAGRLVAEQDLRVVGERAHDRDALLLAAGEPRRTMLGARREPDPRPADAAALSRARARPMPAIICGSMTFSSAENSGSR